MKRGAFFSSLTLHGAVISLVAWQWASARIGPAQPGADASFFADASSVPSFVLEESTPEPTAESPAEPPVENPEPAIPVRPVLQTIAPALLSVASEVSAPIPAVVPREIALSKPASAPAKSARPAGRRSAERSAGSGQGAAGGGHTGGPGYVAPQFRLRYKPLYPEEARARHLEGTVLLMAWIDESGRVTETQLQTSCGFAILDRCALKAVRAWRFDPARQDGTAICARVEIPVRFRFEDHAGS